MSRYWIDSRGVLHGPEGENRPATEAESWFQTERDRFGEALEAIIERDPIENALDPQWPARIARGAMKL